MADSQADVLEAGSQLKKLSDFIKQLKGADKDRAKRMNEDAASCVRTVEKLLRAVETEAKNAPPSQRRQKQEVLAQLKQELQSRRSELQKINDASQRDTLLTKNDKAQARQLEVDDKAAAAADKASSSTTKLLQAQQVLNETTDLGVTVVDTMTHQRESLLRTQNKAANVNTLTGTARSIMRGIQARAITNKALLVFGILILLGCIAGIVYYGYIYSPKK